MFQEAVRKVFEKALQHCDPEKLHLALFDIYERTGQSTLANELIDKMSKKLFKKSIEVCSSFDPSLVVSCNTKMNHEVCLFILRYGLDVLNGL